MLHTTRRGLLRNVVAGAAFGFGEYLTVTESAWAQHTRDPVPGFYRYKVGSVECTALYDGIWEKPHDPVFIANATIEETKQALSSAGLTTAFVPIPMTVLVLNINGKLVLCDAGTGGQVQSLDRHHSITAGKMLVNMRAAGINPNDIETILISHFHPDHIYGLMTKDTNEPIFPHAEIIVPAAEYRWWTDASLIERLPDARKPLGRRIQAVFPNWRNILQVDGEDEVVLGVRFVSMPGHTPGHTAFHVSSGDAQLMISNDAAYLPALVAAHPGWHGVFDQDASMAETSRRKLLDRVLAEKMTICGYHFPWPGVGTLAKQGNGYQLMPHQV